MRKAAPLLGLVVVSGVALGVDAVAAPTAPSPSPAPSASSSSAPTGKPDLKCELSVWGRGNTPMADDGTAKGIVEANDQRSFEYALKVKNEGGATGSAFLVRYDFTQKVGDKKTTSSKPNVSWSALGAGQELTTPRLKLTSKGPFPVQHEIAVTLDTENKVAESDESNNVCKVSVKLVAE